MTVKEILARLRESVRLNPDEQDAMRLLIAGAPDHVLSQTPVGPAAASAPPSPRIPPLRSGSAGTTHPWRRTRFVVPKAGP